ncbi:MAG: T9SS type A sorting domain-containing protein [Bacteroidota bacterium]
MMKIALKSTFYSLIALCAFLSASLSLQAQAPNTAFIANGGSFSAPGNMVTVGAYDIANQTYAVFDSFPASSVQKMIRDGRYGYLAADSFVVRYDFATRTRTHIKDLKGVRQLAIYGDDLLVTRGFGATSDYVVALDKSDLSDSYVLSAVSGACEGIAVSGDSAYVAVSGSYPYVGGKLAVIDLVNETLDREIDYDSLGKDMRNVYAVGGMIYSISAIAWNSTYGVFNRYNSTNGVVDHIQTVPVGKGLNRTDDDIYALFGGAVGTFDLNTDMVSNASVIPGNFAAGEYDPVQSRFYLTETDFFSYGRLKVYDANANVIDSVEVDLSPEAMVLYDGDVFTSAANGADDALDITAWPNPAQDVFHIRLDDRANALNGFRLQDATGRTLRAGELSGIQADLSVAELPAGMYFITVQTKSGENVLRLLK